MTIFSFVLSFFVEKSLKNFSKSQSLFLANVKSQALQQEEVGVRRWLVIGRVKMHPENLRCSVRRQVIQNFIRHLPDEYYCHTFKATTKLHRSLKCMSLQWNVNHVTECSDLPLEAFQILFFFFPKRTVISVDK